SLHCCAIHVVARLHLLFCYFPVLAAPPPRSPPFPYTTLFRSPAHGLRGHPQSRSRPDPDVETGCRAADRDVLGAVVGAQYVSIRSEEHTSELQSLTNLVCRLLLEKKNSPTHTCITRHQTPSHL